MDYELKKKMQIIAYHILRKGVKIYEWITAYVNKHDNPVELFMTVIPISDKQWGFVRMLQNHIFEYFLDGTAVAYY